MNSIAYVVFDDGFTRGKSGSPYPLDPRCILRISTVFRIRKSLPNSHIGNTMGIRTINWESRESRGYYGNPENPEDTVEIQRIRPGSKG
jgi:hypothetical protein